MDDAALGLGAWWGSVRGFFTPATLFLAVNLVIATIALTSRSRRRNPGSPHHHNQEENHPYYDDRQQQQQEERYVDPPAPLARTSSVLDRLRSVGLYRFRSGDFPPEYAAAPAGDAAPYARSRSDPAPAPREKTRMRKSSSSSQARQAAASARGPDWAAVREEEDAVVDAPAEEFSDRFMPAQQQQQQQQQEQEEEEVYYREEYVPPLRPAAPLARAPSVLDRLRSFSLYRFASGDLGAEAEEAQHYGRSQSERQSNKGKKQQGAAAEEERRMGKSSSETRKKPAVAREEAEQGVDARADDFINSFRQQLQLQRLNSLLNYKEMLNRGSK